MQAIQVPNLTVCYPNFDKPVLAGIT
ncbi:uncharacterized protein METZ01_LOCUS260342, partial [marine metagenome]